MVLPENVVDVDCSIAGSLPDSQIRAQARRLNIGVVVGIVEKLGNKFRNAAVLWGPDGGRPATRPSDSRAARSPRRTSWAPRPRSADSNLFKQA